MPRVGPRENATVLESCACRSCGTLPLGWSCVSRRRGAIYLNWLNGAGGSSRRTKSIRSAESSQFPEALTLLTIDFWATSTAWKPYLGIWARSGDIYLVPREPKVRGQSGPRPRYQPVIDPGESETSVLGMDLADGHRPVARGTDAPINSSVFPFVFNTSVLHINHYCLPVEHNFLQGRGRFTPLASCDFRPTPASTSESETDPWSVQLSFGCHLPECSESKYRYTPSPVLLILCLTRHTFSWAAEMTTCMLGVLTSALIPVEGGFLSAGRRKPGTGGNTGWGKDIWRIGAPGVIP